MTPYGNRLDALIVSHPKEEKEDEEKNNDEWVHSVILSRIGLGAQIWVLLLELKQKSWAQEVGGVPKLKVGA